MKNQQRHENGTIIGWSDDGEESVYDSAGEAYEDSKDGFSSDYEELTLEDFERTFGTDAEPCSGTTFFRYGVDEEATAEYDKACAEADAERAEQDE